MTTQEIRELWKRRPPLCGRQCKQHWNDWEQFLNVFEPKLEAFLKQHELSLSNKEILAKIKKVFTQAHADAMFGKVKPRFMDVENEVLSIVEALLTDHISREEIKKILKDFPSSYELGKNGKLSSREIRAEWIKRATKIRERLELLTKKGGV